MYSKAQSGTNFRTLSSINFLKELLAKPRTCITRNDERIETNVEELFVLLVNYWSRTYLHMRTEFIDN